MKSCTITDAMMPSEIAAALVLTVGRRKATLAATLIKKRARAQDERKRRPVMLDGHTGKHVRERETERTEQEILKQAKDAKPAGDDAGK